jgi:hypothetical protein
MCVPLNTRLNVFGVQTVVCQIVANHFVCPFLSWTECQPAPSAETDCSTCGETCASQHVMQAAAAFIVAITRARSRGVSHQRYSRVKPANIVADGLR